MRMQTLRRTDLKDHIAEVAARLFYSEGVHAVGVDRIASAADVTKKTLYHHFHSKDELVAAALRRAPIVQFPQTGAPVERLLEAFTALSDFLETSDYRGCPYIIFTAELVDRRHPARELIERRIRKRRTWFRDRAAEAGARDPEMLAEQLDVLFDGALAAGTKRNELAPARAAQSAARVLIDLQCVPRAAELLESR